MEIEFENNLIKLNKEANIIDEFVIDICKILGKHFNYVIISGYLSILFGKPRGTEDIDVFIEPIKLGTFKKFCEDLRGGGFEIFNSKDVDDAFEMLTEKSALRIARKGLFAPNVELKFAKDKWGLKSLEEKIKVILNGNEIFISSLEQNVAFKIYLGSRKDIDDACHLYLLFKRLKYIKEDKIIKLCRELGVDPCILSRCENG